MPEPAKRRARPEAAPEPTQPRAMSDGHPPSCSVAWCPVCWTVGTVQPLAPEALDHLLKAGTELLLAFKAIIDQRADTVASDDGSSARPTLEKIDLG